MSNLLTPREIQKPLDQLNFDQVSLWTEAAASEAFLRIRDEKWLTDSDFPDLKRSIPWLYVDNGCYLRAALIRRKLEEWKYPEIRKIFAFGDMEFSTPWHPTGKMTYKDHVAVLIRTKSRCLVFDPPLSFGSPLSLDVWIKSLQLESTETQLNFSICSPLTLGHNSFFDETDPEREVGLRNGKEMSVDFFTNEFLKKEWCRLEELELDPFLTLKDPYPWQKLDSAKHPIS